MATAATSEAMPIEPAMILEPLAWPWNARRAKARTGMPSLTKLFQMPATTSDTVLRDFEKPQDPSMA